MARLLTLLFALLLAACDDGRELRIYPPDFQTFESESFVAAVDEQSPIYLVTARPPPELSALEALLSDEADLALIENSTPFQAGIRAVLPTYESVLHVMIRQDFIPQSETQPLKNARIHISNNSIAGKLLIDLVASQQGLTPADYTIYPVMQPGQTDIVLYFGPIDPGNTSWYYPGYALVSIDGSLDPQQQVQSDSLGYLLPNVAPKTIPRNTYHVPGNNVPLATVAMDTLLVVRQDVSEDTVYALTRMLIENKQWFAAIAPHFFSGITESFDPLDLSFPLHNGARRYLNRDEPGLLERYAETINLLVYVVFMLLTGVVALAKWGAKRKKGRADSFYQRLLDIRRRGRTEPTAPLLQELDAIEQEAFEALVEEKLAADESFRIFTDLLEKVRSELQA